LRSVARSETILPPSGKSGPFTRSSNCATEESVFSIRNTQARSTSAMLCGGMFVAIPTAMPDVPLTSRFGNWAGSTTGSRFVPV
jgi:hypothetical protein